MYFFGSTKLTQYWIFPPFYVYNIRIWTDPFYPARCSRTFPYPCCCLCENDSDDAAFNLWTLSGLPPIRERNKELSNQRPVWIKNQSVKMSASNNKQTNKNQQQVVMAKADLCTKLCRLHSREWKTFLEEHVATLRCWMRPHVSDVRDRGSEPAC